MFLHDSFFQMACLAGILASLASGTIGSFVVINRTVFIAGSISHSILGGMGLCLWLEKTQGISFPGVTGGALAAAIASALLIGWIHLNYRQREDAVIAAIWSTGMAIGVIFLSLTPGNNAEMIHFLFGNILWVQPRDLLFLGGFDAFLLLIVAWNFRRFLAICFDKEQATLQGVAVRRLYLLLLSIVAVTIVLLVQIIGTILVIALLTIPATLANLFTHRLPSMICAAIALSALFSCLGISAAYALDWPPGATIALLAALCYLIALPMKRKNFGIGY